MTDYRDHYDVAVIGAGPAGTAAALRAAERATPMCTGSKSQPPRSTGRRRAPVSGSASTEAGIEVVRSAIPADAYFRTVVPHIFAVGDANGRDMLVQAAQFEGEVAAKNAVLGAKRRTPHHLLPAGGFTDPDYAGAGSPNSRHGSMCRPWRTFASRTPPTAP